MGAIDALISPMHFTERARSISDYEAHFMVSDYQKPPLDSKMLKVENCLSPVVYSFDFHFHFSEGGEYRFT